MKLQDLKPKAELLNEALKGFASPQKSFSIYLDSKEEFKCLYDEYNNLMPTKLFEPSATGSGDYWFVVKMLGFDFFINYKPLKTIIYETL